VCSGRVAPVRTSIAVKETTVESSVKKPSPRKLAISSKLDRL
jgi:hypothetical protein